MSLEISSLLRIEALLRSLNEIANPVNHRPVPSKSEVSEWIKLHDELKQCRTTLSKCVNDHKAMDININIMMKLFIMCNLKHFNSGNIETDARYMIHSFIESHPIMYEANDIDIWIRFINEVKNNDFTVSYY